jgi:hypothetical protein
MTRVVSVGRSKGIFAVGALGFTLLTLTLVGCPGSLDNPGDFKNQSGSAGSTGSAGAGTAGGGAGMAMAGSSGSAGAPACDMVKLIGPGPGNYNCILAGACHDAMGSAAGLSMMQADWPKLVGRVPVSGPPPLNPTNGTPSICADDPAFKTVPIITKMSPTGAGLLLQKLMGPVCSPAGLQMPSLGAKVKAADMVCFQQWATMLANM